MNQLLTKVQDKLANEEGVIGYGIAWLLGVPISVLVVIYLIFGR